MWYTAEQVGLTPQEIDTILEAIWQMELKEANSTCHDCGVKPGEKHHYGCDVDICTTCGQQVMGCEHAEPGIWDGLWPGVKECKEMKLIVTSEKGYQERKTDPSYWTFDLNEAARRRYLKLNPQNG